MATTTTTKLRIPSIPVRTPKTRIQSTIEQDEEANKIGQRVTIPSLNNVTGILRYVGEPDFKAGIWAGIELDKQGEGKNDGSVQGKRYFTCAPNTGIFINVSKIILHPPPLPTTPPPYTVKPTPSISTSTRRSNLPLTRATSTNTVSPSSSITGTTRNMTTSTSSTTSSTNKKRTLTGLRNSSVPSTTNKNSKSPSPSSTTAAATKNSKSPSPSSTTIVMPKRNTLTPATTTTTTTTTTNMSPTPPLTTQPPPVMVTRKKSSPLPATPSPPPPPLPQTVVPTPTVIDVEAKIKEETNQLYEMLEKVQRERDTLLFQMKNKETAWERLVSSKESLLLQVEEKEYTSQRLQRDLEEQRQQMEELQHGLAERDASLAKNQRDDQKASQDQRRIERLETLVRELQETIKTTQEEQMIQSRQHQGAMDQVRREVTASEAQAASLEKECEELRHASLEAIHAYENSVIEITQKHQFELAQKDRQIQQLNNTIADLRHKQSTLFDDDEDIDTRLQALSSQPDQRFLHRLEEQLELTMTELDSERRVIQQLKHELDATRSELQQARSQVVSVESKYQALQEDFEKELKDKKRLIEEADHAFEQQAKAEDEHYQIKLSKLQLEKEYNELMETNKQLETDHHQLMDEMLALEENEGGVMSKSKKNDAQQLEAKIQLLEKENILKTTQINQLTKDIAELESLVENRVFGESDLEEQLQAERKRVASLERELKEFKANNKGGGRDSFYKNLVISPTTTTTSGTSPAHDEDDRYCELCEQYGHDLLQCKSTSFVEAGGSKKLFCDNCDDFGNHSTEDCPNGDETF